jgi:hypothetical protein
MTLSQLFIALHVIIFAAWFGTDIATFTISRKVVSPDQSPQTRLVLAGVMLQIEVFARLCLPTMLGTGMFLAQRGGYVNWASWFQWLALGVGLAWAGWVWRIYKAGHGTVSNSLIRFDLGWRFALAALLFGVGILSLITGDSPVGSRWLALKICLFATVLSCGIAIRFLLRPFSAAFGAIVAEGSTPERESALQAAIARAQPFVMVIWTCLLLAAVLGVAKPGF